jgi:hypothetical protein
MWPTNATGGGTRGCIGTKGERPAACDSASGRRRPSRPSGTCSPNEGAAGQRPSESSPETPDHFYRAHDNGSRRQTGAVPGGYSGREALRREQCHMLEVESP